jgi:signal transduction histidine kinase
MADGAVGKAVSDVADRDVAEIDEVTEGLRLRTLVHDLRQPVLALDVLAELLSARDDLPDAAAEHVGQLAAQVRWITELLRGADDGTSEAASLPSAARPGGGPGSSYQHRTDVTEVARAAAASATATYQGLLRVEGPEPAVVGADHTALRRALGNLIDNATRAAGPRGQVRVTVHRDPAAVRVSVDDDGPGFGRVQLGNRLGLVMVAQVALQAGGTIEIGASELGGARVALVLPTTDQDSEG